jgi:hypothetical protein
MIDVFTPAAVSGVINDIRGWQAILAAETGNYKPLDARLAAGICGRAEQEYIRANGFQPVQRRRRHRQGIAVLHESRRFARMVIRLAEGCPRGVVPEWVWTKAAKDLHCSVTTVRNRVRIAQRLPYDWWDYNCRMVRKGKPEKMY